MAAKNNTNNNNNVHACNHLRKMKNREKKSLAASHTKAI